MATERIESPITFCDICNESKEAVCGESNFILAHASTANEYYGWETINDMDHCVDCAEHCHDPRAADVDPCPCGAPDETGG